MLELKKSWIIYEYNTFSSHITWHFVAIPMALRRLRAMDFPFGASRSRSDTPHAVGLIWASDQPDAETSSWQNTTLAGDRHPSSQRDSNPQFQQASNWQQSHALDCAATGIGMQTNRGGEVQIHLLVHSKPEVRDSLHIPTFSTHRDKVSGKHLVWDSVDISRR
jgi:hypothetical protein